jgi:aminoglycoside phosphotransferase (APT) family kinase protein
MGHIDFIANPDKDRPSPEWISHLRRRYAIEPQVDRLLTRKMELRAGPGYETVPLDRLSAGVESLIRSNIGNDFKLTDARWLSGGASKLQMAFTLEWHRPGVGFEKTPMVLRMEPAESIVATSRLREFQLIKAVGGTVPVPPVFWCDEDGVHLPYPALVYGFATGVTKPAASTSGVSGSNSSLPPDVAAALTPQFISQVAAIHNLDYHGLDLSAFTAPMPGPQCADWGVDWWERVWEEDADEDIPLLRLAAGWLRRNAPSLEKPSLVHGDYRLGNFLFTEHDMRITAHLDWELGRIGDRHQDLAWTTNAAFKTFAADGKTQLVCSMLPEPEFFEQYQKAAGVTVNPRTLHWYKIYNSFSLAILMLGTGYRIARNAKTHQDVLVTYLMGIGHVIINEMREQLEQGF